MGRTKAICKTFCEIFAHNRTYPSKRDPLLNPLLDLIRTLFWLDFDPIRPKTRISGPHRVKTQIKLASGQGFGGGRVQRGRSCCEHSSETLDSETLELRHSNFPRWYWFFLFPNVDLRIDPQPPSFMSIVCLVTVCSKRFGSFSSPKEWIVWVPGISRNSTISRISGKRIWLTHYHLGAPHSRQPISQNFKKCWSNIFDDHFCLFDFHFFSLCHLAVVLLVSLCLDLVSKLGKRFLFFFACPFFFFWGGGSFCRHTHCKIRPTTSKLGNRRVSCSFVCFLVEAVNMPMCCDTSSRFSEFVRECCTKRSPSIRNICRPKVQDVCVVKFPVNIVVGDFVVRFLHKSSTSVGISVDIFVYTPVCISWHFRERARGSMLRSSRALCYSDLLD